MDNYLKIQKSAEQGLLDFLRFLLENEKIGAVFVLRKTGEKGAFDYSLITDVRMLEDAIPLHPFMPVNAAQELSRFIPTHKPVAAIVKPCELRAFVELVKRSQGTFDNYLLFSYTCGGAFRFETTVKGNTDKLLTGYWKAVVKGENFEGIRPTCQACEHFVPVNADVTVSMVGEDVDKECILFLHSERVKILAEGFGPGTSEGELASRTIDALREKRQAEKNRLFEEIGTSKDLDGMIEIFGRCIGCHGCNRVCPICHCVLCDFESHLFDYEAAMVEKELLMRGGVRLPLDTVLYQLGRLNHMSFSCVGCGMCTEVCPASIPVSALFMRIGEQTAQLFDYVPGRDLDEPVPVTVYKEKELSTLGEE
jgi:formate dehydrogenase subunit beta